MHYLLFWFAFTRGRYSFSSLFFAEKVLFAFIFPFQVFARALSWLGVWVFRLMLLIVGWGSKPTCWLAAGRSKGTIFVHICACTLLGRHRGYYSGCIHIYVYVPFWDPIEGTFCIHVYTCTRLGPRWRYYLHLHFSCVPLRDLVEDDAIFARFRTS